MESTTKIFDARAELVSGERVHISGIALFVDGNLSRYEVAIATGYRSWIFETSFGSEAEAVQFGKLAQAVVARMGEEAIALFIELNNAPHYIEPETVAPALPASGNGTIISTTRNVRISKKLAATLPAEVMAAIRNIQAGHPNIKTLTYSAVTPAHKFCAGEGYEFTLIYGNESMDVEVAAEHNLGAAGQYHNIGSEFTAPAGAWVLQVSYYGRYFLHVFNVQLDAITAHYPA